MSAIPDAVYPAPDSLVRRIRSEIDKDFVPLWVTYEFKHDVTGGTVRTGHHVLARHVKHPRFKAPVVKNLVLPSSQVNGIRYEQPILQCFILDGLSDEERNKGCLPKYVPMNNELFHSLKQAMWLRNNQSIDETADQAEQAEEEAYNKHWRDKHKEFSYRRKNDSLRFRQSLGTADRVYVSDTLVRLREIAGGAA